MSKAFDPAHATEHGYTRADWDDVCDNPEWTSEDVARAEPLSKFLPGLQAALTAERKPGPARTKTPVTIRLDDSIVSALRASGPGWQTRVNDVLKDWLAKVG